jgi:broad-specificity NMP kinase
MKKVKVITGKNGSGKSTIARALASSINENEKIFFNQKNLNSVFGFSECSEKTKVVIIDELKNNDYLMSLIFTTTEGIEVDKPFAEPFVIHPEVIVVCNESISKQMLLDMGASIARRIEIIETIS